MRDKRNAKAAAFERLRNNPKRQELAERAQRPIAESVINDVLINGDRFYRHYTSTYCIHGRHGDCRLTCKTCERPCLCPCHTAHNDGPGIEQDDLAGGAVG